MEINIEGLAADLALNDLENNWSDSIELYTDDEDGGCPFTPEAEEIYNSLYKRYYEIITSNKI